MIEQMFSNKSKNIIAVIISVLYSVAVIVSLILFFFTKYNLETISVVFLPLSVSLVVLSLMVQKNNSLNKLLLPISFCVILVFEIFKAVVYVISYEKMILNKIDHVSDLIFTCVFIIGNFLCLAAVLYNRRIKVTAFIMALGSIICVVSKLLHMCFEYHYSGGFYTSLPDNSTDFTVGICLGFVLVILIYLSLFILSTNITLDKTT